MYSIPKTGKSQTIFSEDEIEIMGDILYSDDYYMQVLDDFGSGGTTAVTNWEVAVSSHAKNNDSGALDWPHSETTGDPYTVPFNDYNAAYMEIELKGITASQSMHYVIYQASCTVGVAANINIVAPHQDIDENKVYVNVRGNTNTDIADISLILEDVNHVLIASSTLMGVTDSWQRLVVGGLICNDVIALRDDGFVSLKFSLNTVGGWENFLVDELCFAVGKPYPLRVDFDNDPNPCNGMEDAIALISSGSIFVNPWYLSNRLFPSSWPGPGQNPPLSDSIKYFAINGDYTYHYGSGSEYRAYYYAMKMAGLFYINTPGCGMSWRSVCPPEPWSSQFQIEYTLRYGGIIKRANSSGHSNDGHTFYDREFQYNVSPIIPVATAIHSWQKK